jgi:hypothetical protein
MADQPARFGVHSPMVVESSRPRRRASRKRVLDSCFRGNDESGQKSRMHPRSI